MTIRVKYLVKYESGRVSSTLCPSGEKNYYNIFDKILRDYHLYLTFELISWLDIHLRTACRKYFHITIHYVTYNAQYKRERFSLKYFPYLPRIYFVFEILVVFVQHRQFNASCRIFGIVNAKIKCVSYLASVTYIFKHFTK